MYYSLILTRTSCSQCSPENIARVTGWRLVCPVSNSSRSMAHFNMVLSYSYHVP
uniref:Uncharacterized protein n=1 Tax=Anguilla anguilla TaxID=7936 RepID=A0A0E9WG45_ANGAN